MNRRSPDGAKIKDKMVSASSRDAIRRSLVGIAVEIQGTDYSEVAFETGGCGGCLPSSDSPWRLRPRSHFLLPVLDKANRGH